MFGFGDLFIELCSYLVRRYVADFVVLATIGAESLSCSQGHMDNLIWNFWSGVGACVSGGSSGTSHGQTALLEDSTVVSKRAAFGLVVSLCKFSKYFSKLTSECLHTTL